MFALIKYQHKSTVASKLYPILYKPYKMSHAIIAIKTK